MPGVSTTVLDTFERWKSFLSERVEQAKKSGMSEDLISKIAYQIGEFLEDKVDPKNGEERLLKELWNVSDEEEKQAMARIMVKFVDKN